MGPTSSALGEHILHLHLFSPVGEESDIHVPATAQWNDPYGEEAFHKANLDPELVEDLNKMLLQCITGVMRRIKT